MLATTAPDNKRGIVRPRLSVTCMIFGDLLIFLGFLIFTSALLASFASEEAWEAWRGYSEELIQFPLYLGAIGIHLLLLGFVLCTAGFQWRRGKPIAAPREDDVPVPLLLHHLIWFFFSFRGRVSRVHWWLWQGCLMIAIYGITLLLGFSAEEVNVQFGIMYIALLWPTAVITAKRLHDHGASGWWQLVVVVPVLGALGLLVYCGFMRGNLTYNRYGPDPLSSSTGVGIPAKLT